MKRSKRKSLTALTVIVPIMVYFLFFTIPPLISLFTYSFTDLRISVGTEEFIGFRNFVNIFKYSEYIRSFGVTMLMAVLLVFFGLVISFFISLLLNAVKKGKTFFRALWYIPVLIPMPVIAKLMNIMLFDEGSLNSLLAVFGVAPVKWMESTFWMYFWIVFLIVWKNIGSNAIIFISGLNGISKEVYEASEIDGVNRFQKLWYITLPLLRPIMSFVIINGFIGAMSTFEPVKLISGGGPNTSTKTILYMIYDEAFMNFKQGFAMALSVLVFIIVLIITVINMFVTDSSLITGKERD